MDHPSSIHLHIISGEAGAASELMARLALHLGHDPEKYPFELAEIGRIRLISMEKGWRPWSRGTDQFFGPSADRHRS